MLKNFLLVLGPWLTFLGVTALCGFGLSLLMGMWREHTEASRALAADVDAGLTAAGKHRQLAQTVLGMRPPKLSAALNVGEPLNVWRLAALPDVFWLTLIARIAERYGAVVIMPQQVELLRGAAHLNIPPKKMLRMGITPAARRLA